MKTKQTLKTLALATTLAVLGALGGFIGDAKAQAAVDYRTGDSHGLIGLLKPADQGSDRGIIAIKPGELVPAVMPTDQMPTDQRGGFIAGAYGDVLGRKAGDMPTDQMPTDQLGERGIIAIKPGELVPAVMPTDQMPTDQRGGAVQQAYGDLLGRKAGDGAAGGGLTKVGPGTLTLGSLNNLHSMNNLFLNSKGGDQGTGLLLPAVQKVREAAARSQAGDGSVMPGDEVAHGAGGGGGAGKGAEQLSLNFTRVDAGASGGGGGAGKTSNPIVVKGLNFSNTARK